MVTRYIAEQETDAPEHVKRQWRAALEAGHEVGLHTHNHPHGTLYDSEQWSEEIATCRGWLTKPFHSERAGDPSVGLGARTSDLIGFRAPYLELGLPLFAALRDQGIQYDCSVEEGFEEIYHGRNMNWPYRVEPLDGSSNSGGELWEIPAYAFIVPPDEECGKYGVEPGLRQRLQQVQDYFDPADGKITGFDWNLWVAFGMTRQEVLATAKYTLDQRLAGNRAPFTFGAHSDIYSDLYEGATANSSASERRQALEEILNYALSKPEVRVVSAKQILDWLRDPVRL